MNKGIPKPHFDESEVDHLIRDFGVKPNDKQRKSINKSLKPVVEKMQDMTHGHTKEL